MGYEQVRKSVSPSYSKKNKSVDNKSNFFKKDRQDRKDRKEEDRQGQQDQQDLQEEKEEKKVQQEDRQEEKKKRIESERFSNIKKILKKSRASDIFYSHVSMMEPLGSFTITKKNIESFWEEYSNYILEEKNIASGIAENPRGSQEYSQVRCDVDLCVDEEFIITPETTHYPDSLYTETQLLSVVEAYQETLKKVLHECSAKELRCFVLEKPLYVQNRNNSTVLKNGFHLQFPYLFVNNSAQENHIVPRVKEYLKNLQVFKNLGIEDSGTVIDAKACISNAWLLYGSKKNDSADSYRVTKVVDANREYISLKDALDGYELFNDKERLIPIEDDYAEFFLPRVLSIIPSGRKTKEIKKNLPSPLKDKLKKERKASYENSKGVNIEETLELCKKLLPMLSDARADSRDDWLYVGWILYNETDGDPRGLDLWCEFSARCEDKYDENVCITEWDKMKKKSLSIGTLKHLANVDSPEEYKKFKAENVEKKVRIAIEGAHNDIAKIMFEEFGDEFKCASIRGKAWYQFKNHIWTPIEEGIFLREKISSVVVQHFNAIRKKICDEEASSSSGDKSVQAMYAAKLKALNKLIGNLKNRCFKNNIMGECEEVFYDPLFKEKLDTNPYLIAFKNGVYDLKNNIFRPGLPEDYLSKKLPINYRIFNDNHPDIQEVYSFLEKVFPDNDVRQYFLDTYSEIFVGGNQDKTGVFWTGTTDNGKSVTQNFLEQMLGPFAVKVNTTNLTAKKPGAGNAHADMARTGGGVRLITIEEPDADECINSGTFKHWTGSDSIFARDLFEKGKETKEIIPLFKLVFICNKLPRIRGADKAVWNRVKVIPFESTFCRPEDPNPPPTSYEEQLAQKRFPMDKHFSKKIPELVEALAYLLLQHRLKPKMSYEPTKVRLATETYRRQNDFYKKFVDECIKEEKGKTISLTELYLTFTEWFKESYRGQQIPSKDDVEDHFFKLWGDMILGKKWYGYRVRTEQDDIVVPVVDYSELEKKIKKDEKPEEKKEKEKEVEEKKEEDIEDLESDSEDEVVVKKKKKTSASSQPEKKSKSSERKSPKVIKSK